MRQKKLIKQVLKISDGLLGKLADLVLYEFFISTSLMGKGSSSRGIYRGFWEADKLLQEFNYQTIKQSLAYLKRKGLVRLTNEPAITAAGKRRLESVFPVYDEERAWDKSVYLIVYDISEKRKHSRDRLRGFLEDLGAAYFQRSVWLTVYNPEKLLKEFVKQARIEGEIVVSCVGKDGYIGEESVKELVAKVFDLENVNREYSRFIKDFSGGKKVDKTKVRFAFLSILQNDPQLPFELLPDDWAGERAYRIYQKLA